VAQALGGEQVGLAPQPGQHPAVLGDLALTGGDLLGGHQVAALGEQRPDPVERPGQRVRGGADLLAQRLGLPLEADVAFGPAGVHLPVVAAVAGVRPQGPAQGDQLRVVLHAVALAAPVGVRRDDARAAQRRRQVPAHLR
jgi:hypothetical protein